MADFVAVLIIVVLVGLALSYIIKEKKKGNKCIGCPSASGCSKSSCSIDMTELESIRLEKKE